VAELRTGILSIVHLYPTTACRSVPPVPVRGTVPSSSSTVCGAQPDIARVDEILGRSFSQMCCSGSSRRRYVAPPSIHSRRHSAVPVAVGGVAAPSKTQLSTLPFPLQALTSSHAAAITARTPDTSVDYCLTTVLRLSVNARFTLSKRRSQTLSISRLKPAMISIENRTTSMPSGIRPNILFTFSGIQNNHFRYPKTLLWISEIIILDIRNTDFVVNVGCSPEDWF